MLFRYGFDGTDDVFVAGEDDVVAGPVIAVDMVYTCLGEVMNEGSGLLLLRLRCGNAGDDLGGTQAKERAKQ